MQGNNDIISSVEENSGNPCNFRIGLLKEQENLVKLNLCEVFIYFGGQRGKLKLKLFFEMGK